LGAAARCLEPFDGDAQLQYPNSDLQKTDEGDKTGHGPFCFLRSKRKEEKRGRNSMVAELAGH